MMSLQKRSAGQKFAICMDSSDYPVSLQKGKIYFVIPDEKAEKIGMIRIIDESEEDYQYDKSYFEFVELSPGLKTLIEKAYSNT